MQKSSETTSGTVAYIFFTTSKVAQGVFVCMFKAYMHIQNIALYQGTVLPSNQEISKKKKGLRCYFGSPISFLKIGSRAKELNVMSATAEAIHGP